MRRRRFVGSGTLWSSLALLGGCAPLRSRLDGLLRPGAAEIAGASGAEGYFVYTARFEDTLIELARRFGLGYVEFQAANPGVDPWLPGEGTALRVPWRHLPPRAPKRGIVINVGDMRLYDFSHPDGVPRSYPIGIGRQGHSTPIGRTRVVRKKERPTWYPPASIRREKPDLPRAVPPGPDNPLGAFALYLGWPAYLVHGTNIPWSVGRRASNGCIRLYPEHIRELYARVNPGVAVRVVNQPVKWAVIDGEVHLEAHPDLRQAEELEERGRFSPRPVKRQLARLEARLSRLGAVLERRRAARLLHERRGYPEPVGRVLRG